MQWQSVWAAEGESSGLTVWAADTAWQPKLIHRFPVNLTGGGVGGGMGVLYPAPVRFLNGSSGLRDVGAPFRILILAAMFRYWPRRAFHTQLMRRS